MGGWYFFHMVLIMSINFGLASESLGVDITQNVLENPYCGANYIFSKQIIE